MINVFTIPINQMKSLEIMVFWEISMKILTMVWTNVVNIGSIVNLIKWVSGQIGVSVINSVWLGVY